MRKFMGMVFFGALLPIMSPNVSAENWNPLEPADTSSPRATLTTFLDNCNEIYAVIQSSNRLRRGNPRHDAIIERILRCLDLSQQPEFMRSHMAGESAVCLKEVLDRIELPPEDAIPAAPSGSATAATGGLVRWTIPDTEITIARVKDGARQGEYLFSPETVDRAAEFYERVKHLPYRTEGYDVSPGFYEWFLSEPGWMLSPLVRRFPEWSRRFVYGQALWQWVGLGLTVLLGLSVMLLVYQVDRRRAPAMRETGLLRYLMTLFFPIVAMLIPLLVGKFIAEQIRISGAAFTVVNFSSHLIFLLAALVVLVGAGNRVAELIIASPRIHPKGIDAQLIRILCRVLSLVAATIVFLEGGKYLGIPLTTLLAGAGVGGLAVALAFQDTLKNFFGSMMILLDRPYRVGERISVKHYDGVVEEIGLRSTKIRLLTGHVASIPNEEMARSDIENIGRRPFIRRIADIAIPLDTPPEQCEKALDIVRGILKDHEGMPNAFPPRVYLNELNRDSLNLRMIYWYQPPKYWDFLAFSEKVNLQIKRDFAAQGIRFALPSTANFITQDNEHPFEMKATGNRESSR